MLVATQTFHTPGRTVVEGEEVDPKDSVVAGREHLFVPAEDAPVPAKKAPARKAAAKKAAED